MKQCSSAVVLATVWLVLVIGASAAPASKEERRRKAADMSFIRMGRSYPPEPSAADIRDYFQRPSRRGNSFLRLGRSQPLALTTDDLISLLRSYDDEYDGQFSKRATNFVRLGRDPKFIRLGRSADQEKALSYEQSDLVGGYPQRKNRARDHFVRLGRDSEELGEMDDEVERRKRSPECQDCH